jgi:RNA polymerase sigma factor (sigma-70 family)
MARTNDPRRPHLSHLRLLPPSVAAPPLPSVVPLLSPERPVSPTQDAVLTALARRARHGDRDARELLWRAFSPMLEPVLRRSGRMTWRPAWARRDGRPWELDDVRQEAWLVFSDLVDAWSGDGSFIPYVTAYFSWRLHAAMRRLEPPRRSVPLSYASRVVDNVRRLDGVEDAELLAAMAAALPPPDADLLRLRVAEGASVADIACRLGVSRRTIARRWKRIQRVARALLDQPGSLESRGRTVSGPPGVTEGPADKAPPAE